MPGHHLLNDFIHTTVSGIPMQLLVTVLSMAVLLGIGLTVRAIGTPLKERFDSALVESLQAGFLAVCSALIGVFLISVWRASGLIERGFEQIDPSSGDIVATVLSIAILVGGYTLTRLSKNTIRRLSQERGAITNHQQEIGHHLVQILVFVLAGLVVLGIWGVNPGDLLLGASVATVVFGLAARQTLGAVLAGFVVLFSRPFELGDWVVIDDKEGIVTDISIVNTQIRTFDEEYVMIPNDLVTDTEVTNRSRKGRLRLETDVGVDYATDVDHARDVAAEAMAETETPMDRPNPHVVLSEFGGSSVVLRLRYYIENPSARKMWKARTEVITAVKDAFAAEGIKIPFPQRELSGRKEAGGLAVTGGVRDEDDDAAEERIEREPAADEVNGADDGDVESEGSENGSEPDDGKSETGENGSEPDDSKSEETEEETDEEHDDAEADDE